jgi:hypothetical protein
VIFICGATLKGKCTGTTLALLKQWGTRSSFDCFDYSRQALAHFAQIPLTMWGASEGLRWSHEQQHPGKFLLPYQLSSHYVNFKHSF